MGVRLSEARRVGRYIENLSYILSIGSEEEFMNSDIFREPDKVMEILLNIPPHQTLDLLVFMQSLMARALKDEGDVEGAREIVSATKGYLLALKFNIQILEESLKLVEELIEEKQS